MNRISTLLVISLITLTSYAQKGFDRDAYMNTIVNNTKLVVTKEKIRSIIDTIKKVHPYSFDSIGNLPLNTFIENLELPKDSLNYLEFSRYLSSIFEPLSYEDSHFSISPRLYQRLKITNEKGETESIETNKIKIKEMPIPPFVGINIHDTVIVKKSYCDEIKRGDIIKSINNIPIESLISSDLIQRHVDPERLTLLNDFLCYNQYNITLHRNNKDIEVKVDAIPLKKNRSGYRYFSGEYMKEDGIGYCKIRTFTNNKYIFKDLNRFCKKVKKNGGDKIIIDLRGNPGGSGDYIDSFLSIFCDKDSIYGLKSAYVRASKFTSEYNFKPEQITQNIPLEGENCRHTFPLKKKLFLDLDLYVFIDKDTHSSAASFANLVQYNNIGTIVGEKSVHNVLKYGEIVPILLSKSMFILSTVKYSEYTKSNDGYLYPDIPLAPDATAYIKSQDPVLDAFVKQLQN
ncbi:hypothetical protein K5X82_08420 [Halosquirtibacter xylanolyticus]|uniref:S41 family peptidase n=1 Tax=Halosquirtibacter xylanolyticus TaxID=3374599 RepID=UPI00374A72F7|nr:hypothetical protein K5X82_08420 [Prolixibacteraceae bacterium]